MTITDQAQKKITEVLDGDGFLGISVEGGGCSGYKIKLSPSGTLPEDATMITENIFSDGDSINLSEMGYDKLLGKGRIDRAIHITVAEASARAIEKVEAAGGSVTIGDDGGDGDEWEEE